MLDLLFGKAGVIAAAAAVIISMLGALAYGIKKAGRDEQKAKEADAYEKHLDDIARAGSAKPVGDRVSDKYNRDNR